MKKGDVIESDIVDYAFEGKGVGKIKSEQKNQITEEEKKFVVFIDNAYPGDRVLATITKIKKNYAEAKLKQLLIKSPFRIDPKCKYFGTCGGCKSQDLDYSQQIIYKELQVKNIFERIGGLENVEVLPIIKSEKHFFYRNKMEYSFSDKRWLEHVELFQPKSESENNFALGMHVPGIFDKVLDIDECWLQSKSSNRVLNFTRTFFKNHQILAYSAKKHTGFLRNLVIKQSFSKNEFLVNLVVSDENERLFTEFTKAVQSDIPEITTLVFNINKKLSQVALGDYEVAGFGPGTIRDFIGKYEFQISANSFFQINSPQAEKLFSIAADFAGFVGDEIVYDLYSGAGVIPIFISDMVKKIYGFENSNVAIEDAKINSEINGVNNFMPILADLNKSILPIVEKTFLEKPDVIIADPPRSGMHPKTVHDILILRPKKIIYISCNPSTQARDVKMFCASLYKLIKLQPVDMFPHTFHIENIALLHLK